MRITYRHAENKDYWTSRWTAIPADEAMKNPHVYPLRYALLSVTAKSQKILEAGCGAGRILRYFHEKGYDIVGMDFIKEAIDKLTLADPTLKAEVGDICNLKYRDGEFDVLMAFGLYHNLEKGLDKAIEESFRVLKPGGTICASFRADNIQTRLTDRLTESREQKSGKNLEKTTFHKMNLTRGEFVDAFENAGFQVEKVFPVENMPILYKFRLFRAGAHKEFNESLGRKDGYQLSPLGKVLQKALVTFAPSQFCNIFVLIAKKPARA